MIKKILKKNVPELLNDNKFWSNSFLSITKHRLYSHYLNPCLDDNDVVLLLALKNGEIVGYMGVFVDYINIEKKNVKVGWLSTWWVNQKTKGSKKNLFDGRKHLGLPSWWKDKTDHTDTKY